MGTKKQNLISNGFAYDSGGGDNGTAPPAAINGGAQTALIHKASKANRPKKLLQ